VLQGKGYVKEGHAVSAIYYRRNEDLEKVHNGMAKEESRRLSRSERSKRKRPKRCVWTTKSFSLAPIAFSSYGSWRTI
jgi:hypothetical protein